MIPNKDMEKKFNLGDRVRSKFYGIVGSVIDVDTDGYIINPDHAEEMWIAEDDAEAYDRKTDFLTRLSELMREFDVSFIAHKTDMPISAYFKDDEIPFARLGKENNKGCGVIITPYNLMDYDKE